MLVKYSTPLSYVLIPILLGCSLKIIAHEEVASFQNNSFSQPSFPLYKHIDNNSLTDWIVNENLICGGYYYEPSYPFNINNPPKNEPFTLTANRTEIQKDGTSSFEGNVTLSQANRRLTSDYVTANRENDLVTELHASGNLIYTEPGLKIIAQQGVWSNQTDTLTLENIYYRYYGKHARGCAKQIIATQNNLILKDANYTTCAPSESTWKLAGKTFDLNKETGRGKGKHITLHIHEVPVFYWPYLDYPIDGKRHSGFLFPRFSTTTNSGFELGIPYYFNIAPNFDLTFTPRLLTERGVDFLFDMRYLTPHSEGEISITILPSDRKYYHFSRTYLANPPAFITQPNDPRILGVKTSNSRSSLHFTHHHRISHFLHADVEINTVGDDNFLVDFRNDIGSSSTTKLLQEALLHYSGPNWEHIFRAQEYQVIHPLFGPITTESYRRQPHWVFSANYPQILEHVNFTISGELANFTQRNNPLTNVPATIGQRYHIRPSLSLAIYEPYGYFVPRIQTDFLAYQLTLGPTDSALGYPTNPSRVIPIIDLHAGLYFDRFFSIKNYHMQQTIEPQIYYLYVPYKNQSQYPNFDSGVIDFSYGSLFRDNRFSGRDRLGDTHQLTTAITTHFWKAETGEERARASIGEIFYYKTRRNTLCQDPMNTLFCALEDTTLTQDLSLLVGEIIVYPNDNTSIIHGTHINPNTSQVNKYYFGLQYASPLHRLINLNYTWLKIDPAQTNFISGKTYSLQQIDGSIIWPINKNIHLLGQYQYDFEKKRPISMIGGFEYQGCCMGLQLVGSRYLKPNDGHNYHGYVNGIFCQFSLTGLSTVSIRKADNALKKAFPGYIPFNQRNQFFNQNVI